MTTVTIEFVMKFFAILVILLLCLSRVTAAPLESDADFVEGNYLHSAVKPMVRIVDAESQEDKRRTKKQWFLEQVEIQSERAASPGEKLLLEEDVAGKPNGEQSRQIDEAASLASAKPSTLPTSDITGQLLTLPAARRTPKVTHRNGEERFQNANSNTSPETKIKDQIRPTEPANSKPDQLSGPVSQLAPDPLAGSRANNATRKSSLTNSVNAANGQLQQRPSTNAEPVPLRDGSSSGLTNFNKGQLSETPTPELTSPSVNNHLPTTAGLAESVVASLISTEPTAQKSQDVVTSSGDARPDQPLVTELPLASVSSALDGLSPEGSQPISAGQAQFDPDEPAGQFAKVNDHPNENHTVLADPEVQEAIEMNMDSLIEDLPTDPSESESIPMTPVQRPTPPSGSAFRVKQVPSRLQNTTELPKAPQRLTELLQPTENSTALLPIAENITQLTPDSSTLSLEQGPEQVGQVIVENVPEKPENSSETSPELSWTEHEDSTPHSESQCRDSNNCISSTDQSLSNGVVNAMPNSPLPKIPAPIGCRSIEQCVHLIQDRRIFGPFWLNGKAEEFRLGLKRILSFGIANQLPGFHPQGSSND